MTDRNEAKTKPLHPQRVAAKPELELGDQGGQSPEDSNGFAPTKTQATKESESSSSSTGQVQKLPTQFGRYRLIRELGRGGMGAVVLAEDTQLGRQVALKIPFLKKASDTRTLKRFQREAKAAAALSHPNLCAVYDYGTFENHHYLSMAYIEGRPLQDYLDSGADIPQRTAAGIVRKMASALYHAHQRGVIHRDLKPSNVMIEPHIGPVITDFGLARCLDDEGEAQLTKDGVAIGTPSYMSPEQLDADSDQIGPPSDIFSLGLIFYEMLTGKRRFQGKVASIIGQILTKDPKSLREIREDIDPHLDQICRKMMARDLSERYRSMAEVANVMRAYLKGELSTTTNHPVTREVASDPEVFIAGLAEFDQTQHPAPSTQGGGGAFIQTQDDFVPQIVISDGESRTSQILQNRTKSPLSRKWLMIGGGCVLAIAIGLFWAFSNGDNADDTLEPNPSPLKVAGNEPSSEELQNDVEFQDLGLPNFSSEPAADSLPNEPVEVAKTDGPSTPPKQTLPVRPLPMPEASSTPSAPKSPAPEQQPKKPQPVRPNKAKGKLDFQAKVIKTINGSTTEKNYKLPRSSISEITKLEQRQEANDKALEELRILVLLNGNTFAFDRAKNARAVLAALEEAIVQNIQMEEVISRLKHLNPALTEPLPTDLTPSKMRVFRKQFENIYNTEISPFLLRMNKGRGPQSQNDLDLAQLRYEQECRKIKGLPDDYPLPRVRARLVPIGAINPNAFPMIEGNSQRYKDQTPRGQLTKRLAEALNQGTLVRSPDSDSEE